MKLTKIQVKTNNQKYPIIIGTGSANKVTKLLKDNSINFNQCLLVIDSKVPKKILKKILALFPKKNTNIYYFNSNEKNKNQKNVDKIISILLQKNFNRNDCLISIGGGITGDVSSFAASIFKRGLKFVNMPTTLLSQVDSSIGGKTGINTKYGKNLIGSFYQPSLVISDINFLKSLPKREIICGYGEILKHSLISDKKFFLYLDKNGSKIINLKNPFIQKAIFQSCCIKKKIVEADEKEMGIRKILNFGHTFAHAYEAALGYSKKLNHGEAVILGINSALKFSLNQKFINKSEYASVVKHIKKFKTLSEIKNYFSNKSLKRILFFMTKDKKNKTNKINLILLKKIGSPIIDNEYNINSIRTFLKSELNN